MNWQPIETCPYGEDVLIYVRGQGVRIAMDCTEEGADKKQFLDWSAFDPGMPTHWMPLPEPPES